MELSNHRVENTAMRFTRRQAKVVFACNRGYRFSMGPLTRGLETRLGWLSAVMFIVVVGWRWIFAKTAIVFRFDILFVSWSASVDPSRGPDRVRRTLTR